MQSNIIIDFGKDYRLIDCGTGYKLEKFGSKVLSRPEPQALWQKSYLSQQWDDEYDAHFVRNKSNPEKGVWNFRNVIFNDWQIKYVADDYQINFSLSLTGFKHVGIFPEQCANWDFIYKKVKSLSKPKVLNMFAYTGGATMAAALAGADTTHVDAVKSVISWANENAKLNNLHNVRWVVDDAMKFVQREIRRGNIYDGIVIDPPAYGRGPEGEKWVLEHQIDELLHLCSKILRQETSFLVLNLYAMGFSPTLSYTLLKSHFPDREIHYGELMCESVTGKLLPLSIYARF